MIKVRQNSPLLLLTIFFMAGCRGESVAPPTSFDYDVTGLALAALL